MPALSIRIALDCFYLLIFYSEKFSTDVCRLPYAVNVNLNLSNVKNQPRPQGFCLKFPFFPFFEGKAPGTRLVKNRIFYAYSKK